MSEELADIATSVIYEDDHVRVWNQVVPGGAPVGFASRQGHRQHAHAGIVCD